jgi:hypothetical protein
MAFDPVRNVTVMYGGRDSVSTKLGDTWELNGTTGVWTNRNVVGPPAREFAAMAYDPVRSVMVLFGGQAGSSVNQNDTWTWNGASWTQRMPAARPPVRYFHSMVWDPDRQRIVVFGGEASSTFLSDTWEWDGSSWTQRTNVGTPPVRAVHEAAYDITRHVLVFYGGYNAGAQAGTWELGTVWSNPTVSGAPSARHGAMMGFDPVTQRVMLVGGAYGLTGAYTYDGLSWTSLSSDCGPIGWGAMTYDSARGKFVLFAGDTGSGVTNATWEY